MPVRIGVIGQSGAVSPQVAGVAREVGAEIARRGGILVCGGRDGVMEAACAGAKAAGGITVGILPGTDDSEANPFVDVPLPTGLDMAYRSLVLIHASQAVIAIGGGNGTLGEISAAYLHRKPIVLLRSTGGWAEKLPLVAHEGRFVDHRRNVPLLTAETPAQAVAEAFRLARILPVGAVPQQGSSHAP